MYLSVMSRNIDFWLGIHFELVDELNTRSIPLADMCEHVWYRHKKLMQDPPL